MHDTILTINGGSSSIKFALFQVSGALQRTYSGTIDRIGLSKTQLRFKDLIKGKSGECKVAGSDYASAVAFLVDWLESQATFSSVKGVGHRVVHGMQHTQPEVVTSRLLDQLHRISPFAPEHLPGEIKLIEAFRSRYPQLPQIACFDTAFHRSMPRIATLLSIPRRYEQQGVVRYGFHGLSYSYLMQELQRVGDPAATDGRVILAHLGNGASMTAIRERCSRCQCSLNWPGGCQL